tara:strand:+ start:257 stop:901 length:645 start_codon:yes stop_codon:yes gene_type:complete
MKILNIVILVGSLLVFGCGDKQDASKQAEDKSKDSEKISAKAVDISKLQVRGNLAYLPNEKKPYTGWIKKLYDGSEQIEGLIEFKKGEPSEILLWYPNGSPWFVAPLNTGSEAAEVDLNEVISEAKTSDLLDATSALESRANGTLIKYFENGKKEWKVSYVDGKMHGTSIEYREDGSKEGESVYENGEFISSKEWDEDGNLVDPSTESDFEKSE